MASISAERAGTVAAALRRSPLLADALFAIGAFAIDTVLTALLPDAQRPHSWPVTLLVSAASALPIALRRVAPWPAVALTLATLAGPLLLAYSPLTSPVAFVVVTYTTAARFPYRRALLAWVALWLPVFAFNVLVEEASAASGLTPGFLVLYNLLIALVAFFMGRTVHARRTSTRALEERARAAEANQRALADQAVADERRRIARELHDVVAHHVSVMGVLATGARRVLARRPEAADEALATIEDTSRTTLREMRRLLDVLRTDAEPAVDLAPQPEPGRHRDAGRAGARRRAAGRAAGGRRARPGWIRAWP